MMRFTKMQGLGNDFVVLAGPREVSPEEVVALCDRRRGVGADGVLVVTPGEPVRMDYWNADGSAAEMCGNGLRCAARFALDRGWAAGASFVIRTELGDRRVEVGEGLVTVELGPVHAGDRAEVDGVELHLASVGNPHAVAFVSDPLTAPVTELGPALQSHPRFPDGVNVEFVTVAEPDRLKLRVWERGVGETLACGTGAAAAVAVAHQLGKVGEKVTVELPGGEARVSIAAGTAWLSGPAEYVFEGEWPEG